MIRAIRGRITSESGSMLPMTAGLIFVAFSITALVTEIALIGAAYRDIATVADIAAESGAMMISVSGVYNNEIILDQVLAEREARNVSRMWGSGDESVAVDVSTVRICVSITDTYRPRTLVFIGVNHLSIRARGCAEPLSG